MENNNDATNNIIQWCKENNLSGEFMADMYNAYWKYCQAAKKDNDLKTEDQSFMHFAERAKWELLKSKEERNKEGIEIIIKTDSDYILFKYKKRNNTVKDTLIQAVKRHADVEGASLRSEDFRGIDLSRAGETITADFANSDFRGSKFIEANLERSNFRETDFEKADLRGASLEKVIFIDANLKGTNFKNANLKGAKFDRANLYGVNFENANLEGVSFRGAYLKNVNIKGAILKNNDFKGAKFVPNIKMDMPDGEFIGWKKLLNGLIVKLKILKDSKRSRGTGDLCRCDKCIVLEFQNMDGTKSGINSCVNNDSYGYRTYTIGKTLRSRYDKNRWNEWSYGIMFYLDRQAAITGF
jgi:hypothetical protein